IQYVALGKRWGGLVTPGCAYTWRVFQPNSETRASGTGRCESELWPQPLSHGDESAGRTRTHGKRVRRTGPQKRVMAASRGESADGSRWSVWRIRVIYRSVR